jgi:crotonobetainyl-CoA:carnitine CoA-transferase CaiB-like acyl-CoA transferase
MDTQSALEGVVVLEVGVRLAAGVAGSLLAQAGAEVIFVEPANPAAGTKFDHRALAAAGKRSVPAGDPGVAALMATADVVITTDLDPEPYRSARAGPRQIVCSISAFGSSGPLAGATDSDFLIQAVTGVMDVTGLPTEAPEPVGLPVVEISAGLYAASAITAALRYRDLGGGGQPIEVSLYDCGLNAQATFLPSYFDGKSPRRAGNRHAMCAPWNCYQAKDRWILVCSATNDQWLRLCEVMKRPDLAADPRLKALADRLAHCDEVDAAVQQWVGGRSFEECAELLSNAGLACGPIVPAAELASEPNLAHRKFVHQLDDPVSGQRVDIPASPFHATPALGATPQRIPAVGADREAVAAFATHPLGSSHRQNGLAAPLSDIRVLEIGQYTTAPLAARHLATLGADVLKIEPPQGESSRYWPPHKNGQGYFFTLSNSDKQSVMIDLGTEAGRNDFEAMLRVADVFVENSKPGSLERRGFGPRDLARINPQLVYCAISGFGYSSAYPQRPAFDTVIQAMSGVMDLTRSAGVPVKAGISVADIIGGQFALLAILLALKHRDATGRGMFIDLAMQEACAWSTQFSWNGASVASHAVVRCADGYVAAEATRERVMAAAGETAQQIVDDVIARLASDKIEARRVLTVPEVARSAQVASRDLLPLKTGSDGIAWPLLGSPMRLGATPPVVSLPIGTLGSSNEIAYARFGLTATPEPRRTANVRG